VQRMQKALTQMNIQLTNVISDVAGETGQKILRAIVAGERNGQVLAAMKNVRIRATADEIAKSLQVHDGEPAKGKKRGRTRNAPKFDLRTQLFRMCGVDLTRIDGIDATTALAVISETGADVSRFATAGHFASWLGPCPGTKITGDVVMSGKTKRVANRAAQALRLAAAALLQQSVSAGRVFPQVVRAHGQT
jgi:transposase